MKYRNPKSRFNLSIGKKDHVLEVGGGHNPHPRSNVVVDKFVDCNYHRKSDVKVLKNQKFIAADGENLPFEDQVFDYVISNQVLEHVHDPEKFLKEQMRMAKAGYIETPSLTGEYLFPKKAHKWLILEIDNKLIIMDKEKYWFNSDLDFGFLFLTWLHKSSMAWKILRKTNPDLFTVRYEWRDNIEFEVNPDKEDVKKYFSAYWNEKMVNELFPQKSKAKEYFDTVKAMVSITFCYLSRKAA